MEEVDFDTIGVQPFRQLGRPLGADVGQPEVEELVPGPAEGLHLWMSIVVITSALASHTTPRVRLAAESCA